MWFITYIKPNKATNRYLQFNFSKIKFYKIVPTEFILLLQLCEECNYYVRRNANEGVCLKPFE